MPDFYNSATEAAKAIGVSAITIDRWIREGRLPAKRRSSGGERGRPGYLIAHADLIEASRKNRFEETPSAAPMLPLDNAQAARDDALSLQVVWPLEGKTERYNPSILEGFTDFRAVTYSVSIPTVLKLLERGNYERFEVVFGNDELLRAGTAADVILAQAGIEAGLNREFLAIGGVADPRSKALLEWQERGIARFMVFDGGVVHSKYYLLARPGLQRVLVGSANLSQRAFSGKQGEMLLAFDNHPYMWDAAESKFANLWGFAKRLELSGRLVNQIGIVPAETPAGRAVKEQGDGEELELYVYQREPDAGDVTEYISVRTEELREVLGPAYNQVVNTPAQGPVKLTPAKLRSVKNTIDRQSREQVIIKPHRLDYTSGRYIYDGQAVMRPAGDDDGVAQDAFTISQYLDKFREFGAGHLDLQRNYFAFMGWLYFAPFMPRLRAKLEAEGRVAKAESKLAAVIYGPPNAGKTGLTRFLLRSMFGEPQVLGNKDFTSTQVAVRWRASGYLPLFYDDIAAIRFANPRGSNTPAGEEIVRQYDRCADIYPAGYPCLVAVANQESYDYSEAARERCFMVYAWPGLPGDMSELKARLSNETQELSNRIGRAFYAEYLYRMEERFDAADLADFDYLLESTGLIRDMLRENQQEGENPPGWARAVPRMQYDDSAWDTQRKQLASRLGAESYTAECPPPIDRWTVMGDYLVVGVEDYRLALKNYLLPQSILAIDQCFGGYLYLDKTKTLDFIRRSEDMRDYQFPAVGGLGPPPAEPGAEQKPGLLARLLRRAR